MSEFLSQKFGKYLLLEKIAIGGMAELFKAKVTGEGGFEKLLAIKRILPHLSADQDLISMFVNEARLAALLTHQNIVQIYDFGKEGDTYFIAMEYLQGWDLKTVLRKAGQSLPLEFALYITSRICAGLDHSHNLKDLRGDALNLIHRDISPQNIFITCSGEIKILDFGIAKIESKSPTNRPGVLKGKVSYMSPEQAAGEEIDRRSDIFSTGVLLYEMLAGTKMFQGDTKEVLDQVREAQFKTLEFVVQGLPADLYTIVEKALAKDPDERYQSCGEMLTALEGCLTQSSARPTAERLSKYIHDLFAGDTDRVFENQVSETSAPTEADSNLTTMSDFESAERTDTVFDEDEVPELVTFPSRNRLKGRWFGIGLFSLVVSVIVALAMVFLTGKSVEKQQAAESEQTVVEVEVPEPEKKLPPSGEKVSTQLEASEKAEGVDAPDLLKGGSRLAVNHPDESLETIEDSIRSNPRSARAYFELAKLQTKLNNYPKAIELYKRAGALDPDFPDIFFNLGFLYAMVKDYPNSEKMFIQAATLSPSYLDEVCFNLAMVQKAQGKDRESAKSLEKALAINPVNEKALKYIEKTRER